VVRGKEGGNKAERAKGKQAETQKEHHTKRGGSSGTFGE